MSNPRSVTMLATLLVGALAAATASRAATPPAAAAAAPTAPSAPSAPSTTAPAATRPPVAPAAVAAPAAPGSPAPAAKPAVAAKPTPAAGQGMPPEPTYPPPCATLLATKTAVHDGLVPADENLPDTARIQEALKACPAGQSVKLTTDGGKNAFLTGPLKMVSGVTLWVDAKTTLFASRNPRDYDRDAGSPTCGTDKFDDSNGCQPLINVEKISDVGIVGEGVIDGRGGEPMIGSTLTWWDIAQHAKGPDLKHSNPRLIDVKKVRNFTMYKISLFNSPKFHVGLNADHFVVWGVKVITPSKKVNSVGRALSAHYARNTDGIDPTGASNGFIGYSIISVGDDQIAIKAGSQGATTNLLIAHNHFGTGHGMSIGSETNAGVSRINVFDLSIDGSIDTGGAPKVDLNGIRIKSDPSRGGLVHTIMYTDICMRDLPNPIIITPHYSKEEGAEIPEFKNIMLNNIRSIASSGKQMDSVITLMGYNPENLSSITLSNVIIDGAKPPVVKSAFAKVTLGPGPVNFTASGDQVTVDNKVSNQAPPNPCTGKFIKLPVP
jgi:polygalacturonase